MLVRCVQRAYPFLRTERTHGLSSRICKHTFSDWTSLQVKDRFFPGTHLNNNVYMWCGFKCVLRDVRGCNLTSHFGDFSLKMDLTLRR